MYSFTIKFQISSSLTISISIRVLREKASIINSKRISTQDVFCLPMHVCPQQICTEEMVKTERLELLFGDELVIIIHCL